MRAWVDSHLLGAVRAVARGFVQVHLHGRLKSGGCDIDLSTLGQNFSQRPAARIVIFGSSWFRVGKIGDLITARGLLS